MRSNHRTLLACALVASFIFIVAIVIIPTLQINGVTMPGQGKFEFPFEVVRDNHSIEREQYNVIIILSKQHYSQANLNQLFRFYSRKYEEQKAMVSVLVYTDKNRVPSTKEVGRSRSAITGIANPSSEDRPTYDAFFMSAFGLGGSRGERVEMYSYRPDLARPDYKMVVLRGALRNNASEIIQEWKAPGNRDFKIRAISYKWSEVSPSAFYYTFETCDLEGECYPVMTFRQDELIPIPTQQVRYVNAQVAYLFMGWKYAVTTDSGESWSVWDAEDKLPDWRCCNNHLIREVNINVDGSGEMILNPKNGSGDKILRTKDFGRHWERNRG